MEGDSIVIEEHHRRAAAGLFEHLRERLAGASRQAISIAGESGSGKSETAAALAERLGEAGIGACILQQDDYFVYPPRSNDAQRRKDIDWVGPGEVRLALLDEHVRAFVDGAEQVDKPLVSYEQDAIGRETMAFGDAQVIIAEGTYTTLLNAMTWRVFIDRSYHATRAHREKRRRDDAELDPFIDRVLAIEHAIISPHIERADLIVGDDDSVRPARSDNET